MFVIPGLWDMHVHTVFPGGRQVLPLYVANGVTGVRDLAGDWNQILAWRREIAAGTLLRSADSWPRVRTSRAAMFRSSTSSRRHRNRRAPRSTRSLRWASTSSSSTASSPARPISRRRATRKERGLRVAGHVPSSVSVAEASDAGVGSIEHMLQIPISCTPAESLALVPRFPVQRVVGRCSSQDLAPLFARFVQNGTWVVPTLTASYEVAHWPKRDLPGDAYAQYLPDTLKKYVASIFPMLPDIPPDADVVGMQLFAKRLVAGGRTVSGRRRACCPAPTRRSATVPPGSGSTRNSG